MQHLFRLFSVAILSVGFIVSISATPRVKRTINEKWVFYKGDIKDAEKEKFDDNKWEIINLPHTWNVEDSEDEPYGWYRGVGFYRKKMMIERSLTDNRNLFLAFEGAAQVTEVWVNGTKAGNAHIGGYTPFTYDITNLVKPGQENTFAIKVDNSHNEDIIPLSADFTFFGGIYRDVYLVSTEHVHFDMKNSGTGIFIHTQDITDRAAKVIIKSNFDISGRKDISIEHLIINKEGITVASGLSKVKAGSDAEYKMEVKNPVLWDTETPYLYSVVSRLKDKQGNILDEVFNPLGIRWFSFDPDKGFFLNGKHVKLIGTNRHQDYSGYGNALTDDMHRYDMKLLKEMGANCLRISHYPQDPSILEMCDRYGFICFEELPVINRITTADAFYENTISQIREMIIRDYNHPCIVAWNMSNEINAHYPRGNMKEEERAEYRVFISEFLSKLNDFIKSTDPHRVSMVVHCFEPKDNVELGYHNADFIGYNKYKGWYEGKTEDIYQVFADYKAADPEHPFFLSEYGAQSDTRLHSFNPSRYDHSEEYQLMFLKTYLKAIMETDFVVGGTVWNFADFNSEYRSDAIPHINEKGLVTADRRLKACYYYYKTVLSKNTYVSIPYKLWNVRGGREDRSNAGVCTQPVEVFANIPEVELLLNGKLLAVKTVEEYSATFDVPFCNGDNLLQVRATDSNGNTAQDFMKVAFQLQPYEMKSGSIEFNEIAINCGSNCYFNDDAKNNYLWTVDRPYTKGNWGYTGGRLHRENCNVMRTLLDPLYQTQLRGLGSYRFDVSEGNYEITLLFAELNDKKENKRVFDVAINGTTVLENLNVAQQYGIREAVAIRFDVTVDDSNGISVDFTPKEGETMLNGIVCRKVY
ncbi:MAG: DUF4982 domain-containing protein [Prevotellaceae bacterium]|nr:DUF4982 domain-containing protein [Prevotellaceae bacterium]